MINVEYDPVNLASRLPEQIKQSVNEYRAMLDTIRIVVREVSTGEGWALGTIFVQRYIKEQAEVREGLRFDPS